MVKYITEKEAKEMFSQTLCPHHQAISRTLDSGDENIWLATTKSSHIVPAIRTLTRIRRGSFFLRKGRARVDKEEIEVGLILCALTHRKYAQRL